MGKSTTKTTVKTTVKTTTTKTPKSILKKMTAEKKAKGKAAKKANGKARALALKKSGKGIFAVKTLSSDLGQEGKRQGSRSCPEEVGKGHLRCEDPLVRARGHLRRKEHGAHGSDEEALEVHQGKVPERRTHDHARCRAC